MALIQCRECGHTISTEAAACPQCGAPKQPSVSVPPLIAERPGHEETLHSDNYVLVTTTRVIIRGTTYALRNITSVRMAETPGDSTYAILLMIFGIVLTFPALLIAASQTPGAVAGGVCVFLFGGVIVGVAILWMRSIKDYFHVAIASSSGESNVLSSESKEYIVNSVNTAIVKYR